MIEQGVVYIERWPREADRADLGWGALYVYERSALLEIPTEESWEHPASAESSLDVTQLKDLVAAATWAAGRLAARNDQAHP